MRYILILYKMEYGNKLNPKRSLRMARRIKGTRQKIIVTQNPSKINQNQLLTLKIPNLGNDDVIVPDTANLSFNIEWSSMVYSNKTSVSNAGINLTGNHPPPPRAPRGFCTEMCGQPRGFCTTENAREPGQ